MKEAAEMTKFTQLQVAHICHHIRNPLASVAMNVSILKRRLKQVQDSDLRTVLEKYVSAVEVFVLVYSELSNNPEEAARLAEGLGECR